MARVQLEASSLPQLSPAQGQHFHQSKYPPWRILECGVFPKGLFHRYDS